MGLLVLIPTLLHAQRTVCLGGHRFIPEQNVAQSTLSAQSRSGSPQLSSGLIATNGQCNALVQLRSIPSPEQRQQLARQGIRLGDYLGGNAYWALVKPEIDIKTLARASQVISLVSVRPEWKLDTALQRGEIPDYAATSPNCAKVVVRYAENATPAAVRQSLINLHLRDVQIDEFFRAAYAIMPLDAATHVAELPWVLAVALQPPAAEISNVTGRILGRADLLSQPATFGGRGLQGQGIHIGIWDGNVTGHIDFGNRIHVQEYETESEHGAHVAGTVLGSGLLDPDAKGMAPKAEAWTYNFNTGSNGLSNQAEMLNARRSFGITLTQNSYGISVRRICTRIKELGYMQSDLNLDLLTNYFPTLTHVFAAGNDGAYCSENLREIWGVAGYGSAVTRAKNSIYVGAVSDGGGLASFSSRGPQDDGRMFPTVCAKGVDVWSVKPGNSYQGMDGTSMATPTVTGTAALVSERYTQLNQGREIRSDLLRALLANTATDAGRPGPDFMYGYGIMNAERAVKAIEQHLYLHDSLANAQSKLHTIPIPSGCTGLRVMLVWNDPVAMRATQWGDRVLINDLDLSLKAGANDYLPWVCKALKGHVTDYAAREKDTLNNIEQVTLNASELGGRASVTISVVGSEIPAGLQHYTLTWWYEYDEMPRILAPTFGAKLLPGELAYLALENVKPPYSVELSYNGGKEFIQVVRVEKPVQQGYFTLPADAPVTDAALVRVTGSDGRVAVSPYPFTIAPRVEDLKLATSPCSLSGWRLSWKKNDLAVNGYEVLVGDPIKGEFTSVGHTDAADNTEFDIPEDGLKGIEQPVLSVAIRLPNGSGYGKRALGIVADRSVPAIITANSLPFRENFVQWPSRYFTPAMGENVQASYIIKQVLPYAPGSNILSVLVSKNLDDFDETNYFNEAKNAKNMGHLTMCDLDLTGFSTSENVLLHIFGQLITAKESELSTARMQVKDNGQPLADLEGKTVHQASGTSQDWYFKLAGGVHHKLEIVFAGKGKKDGLLLGEIAVERIATAPSVALAILAAPNDSVQMQKGKFTLGLKNLSVSTLENLLVKAYVRGKWVGSYQIEGLNGLEYKRFDMQLDLSTPEFLGELIPVVFECVIDPANPAVNGRTEHTVNNMGGVFTMPSTETVDTWLGPQPKDPNMTFVVKKKLLFTDNGGYYGNHKGGESATLKFLPGDPQLKVRVKFMRFKLQPDAAVLAVVTSDVPASLSFEHVVLRDVLTGELPSPKVYVSEAQDGGFTLYFESTAGSSAEGWVAEVDLVPGRNPLSLTRVEALATGTSPEAEVPVKVTVNNSWPTEQKEAVIRVLYGKDFAESFEETVTIPQGEHTFTLNTKLKLKAATPEQIKVIVMGDDDDASDNVLPSWAVYDRYCVPGLIAKPKKLYFSSIKVNDYRTYTMKSGSEVIRYSLENPILLYKGDGEASFEFRTEGVTSSLGELALAAWVDWNNDGKFADSEKLMAKLENGYNKAATLKIDPSAATPGIKRMRIIAAQKSEIADACTAPTIGDVQDCLIELKSGEFAHKGDLQLSYMDAGQSGNPKNGQSIKVKIANLSNADYQGKLKVQVSLDGVEKTAEELDFTANPLKAYTGIKDFTLTTKVDYTTVGKHTVKVTISDPADKNPENNVKEQTIWTRIPKNDGPYYLAMQSLSEGNEHVAVPTVADKLASLTNSSKSWTVEMIFRVEKPQFGKLMVAPGLLVATTYHMQGSIPDNAIGIQVGNSMLEVSKKNSLTPGVWHHMALVFKEIQYGFYSGSCKVLLFLDGKPTELESYNRKDAPSFGTGTSKILNLATEVNGGLKLFRAWEKELTEAEIAQGSFAYLRDGAGTLPAGCFAEFSFDEGTDNALAASGNDFATITTKSDERITSADGIWKKVGDLIGNFHFDKQVKSTLKPDGHYEVLFENGTPRDGITGSIQKLWPAVKLTYKGNEVTESTQYNFTDEVVVKGEASLFGKGDFRQEIRLSYAEDGSPACDLQSLTLKQEDNPGLKRDVAVAPITQSNVITLAAEDGVLTTPSKVKIDFTVSAGAKLLHNGREIAKRSTEIDLSEPTILTVVAANGKTKLYGLQIAIPQSIVWTLAENTATYGDAPIPLEASCNSNLPVAFVSDNASVATVSNGNLVIGVPGEATITAMQSGGGIYAKAENVSKRITVTRRSITATPRPDAVTFGNLLPPTFDFATLVKPEDAKQLPDPYQLGAYKILNAEGQEMDARGILPVGGYTAKAQTGVLWQNDLYTVTPLDGQIQVVQGDLWQVTFTVKDTEALPLADVSVILEGGVVKTDAAGVANYYLPARAQNYTFTIAKAGYTTESATVNLSTGVTVMRDIILRKADITLTYTVGADGILVGHPTQRVAKGADGERIEAVAKPGFVFTKWSDGRKDNPRVDTNVQAPITAEALFEPATFTITYEIEEGGMLASGPATQPNIAYDGSGAEVTAKAKDGYFFKCWSDGNDEATRKEEHVKGNITVKALFARMQPIMHVNDFEDRSLTNGWYTLGSGDFPVTWEVTNVLQSENRSMKDGYFAVVSSANSGQKVATGALYSPGLRLDGSPDDLVVSFGYIFVSEWGSTTSSFKLEYRVDAGPWTALGGNIALKNLPTYPSPKTIPNSALTGKKNIQFRWTYSDKKGVYAMLDNIVIAKKSTDKLKVKYVADPDGAGVFKKLGVTPITEQEVNQGQTPDKVTVSPNANYTFLRWSTGETKEVLEIKRPVFEDQTITAYFVEDGKVELTYSVVPSDAGTINDADGNPITKEQVQKGKDGKTVTATPNTGYQFLNWSNGSTEKTSQLTAVDKNTTLTANFVAIAKATAKFRVTDGTSPLADAKVSVNGENATTDADGIATIALAEGEYDYTVELAGYVIATGRVKVSTLPLTTKVTLKVEVIFTITDTEGTPVKDATLSIAGSSATSGTDGVVKLQLIKGVYGYRVECPHYIPIAVADFAVKEASNQSVTLTPVRYPITFTVKYGTTPVADVAVKVGETTKNTDSNGQVTLSLKDGEYTYSVYRAGYFEVTGHIQVDGAALSVDVALEKDDPANRIYPITLTVLEGTTPVSGVKVTVGDKNGNKTDFTNGKGQVQFHCKNGVYRYSTRQTGYKRIEGSLTVANGPVELTIRLERDVDAVGRGSLLTDAQAMPNPFRGELTLTGVAKAESVAILDAAGAVVYTQALGGESRAVLQLEGLPAGLYMVVLKAQDETRTLRVVRQ